MKSKLTPGQWINSGNWIHSDKHLICFVSIDENNKMTEDERSSNAALIAAAPELIDALQSLVSVAQGQLDQSATYNGLINCGVLDNARQIIAKAKKLDSQIKEAHSEFLLNNSANQDILASIKAEIESEQKRLDNIKAEIAKIKSL